MSAKARTIWRCQQCGSSAPKWLGRCPSCSEYGSFVEEIEHAVDKRSSVASTAAPVRIGDAEGDNLEHLKTGITEFDRVLGGGFVEGSLVLLGGEPGIGKSTLLLQVSSAVAASMGPVLYVCGEESPSQVAMRAKRIDADATALSLLPEVDVSIVEKVVREEKPTLLVIDSIQTMTDPDLDGAPGSVGQIKASTARLMRIAKDLGVITVVVGHVTKEGAIAGPRVLEHMVDAVLYFEGDSDHAYRVVRSVKNRFGPISEIGVFEMRGTGLAGVSDPTSLFLGDRGEGAPGSVVLAAMEGSRPLLVEVQALVTPSHLQMPRRLATGVDSARLLQVLAVLERRAGLSLGSHDVYVSVAGGIRVNEPAADLALAAALASSYADKPIPADSVVFGEIGLTGRVRPVLRSEDRAREAIQRGFSTVVTSMPEGKAPSMPEVVHVESAKQALDALLGR